jgi:hypothetical protein
MPTKKKKLPSLDISGDILDKIVLLLVSLQSVSAVRAACVEKLGLSEEQADAAIEHARAKIIDAAEVDRDKARGQAIVRLTDLYERALKVQDVKAALAAQKELNKIQGIVTPRRRTNAESDVEPAPGGLAGIMAGRLNGTH